MPADARPATWSKRVATLEIASLAASPDGQLIAIAGVGDASYTTQLWTVDGTKLATLDDDAAVDCLAWSPDSSLLAGAYRSGEVKLWDRDGQVVRIFEHQDPIFSLAWSPDGRLLATGGVHFPASAEPTATAESATPDTVTAETATTESTPTETPSAGVGASATEEESTGLVLLPGVIRIWRLDGTLAETLGTTSTGGKFLNLAWSRDGSMLAAGAQDYQVWRADGTPVGEPRTGGTPAWAMAWSPDDSTLAIGDENGVLALVSPDGTTRGSGSFEGDVDAVAYSPDGTSLAVGHSTRVSVVGAADPGTVLWSSDSAAAEAIWSPDGRALMVALVGGLALVGPNGAMSTALGSCPGNVSAFTWDGPVVIAATDTGWLCGW